MVGYTCAALMGPGQPVESLQLFMESGTLIAPQRIGLAERAIEEGATHILWLDADMRFPKDVLGYLLSKNVPIVGANYPLRMPPCTFTANKVRRVPLITYEDSEGMEEVEWVGFGCVLVSVEVFKDLPEPWFAIPWIEEQKGFQGEDIYFCYKVRKAGFKVLVDHDLSKVVKHIGMMEYTYLHALDLMELRRGASETAQGEPDAAADTDNDVQRASGSGSGHTEPERSD